jgi:DNA-binding beta-propeller fold protein YncE
MLRDSRHWIKALVVPLAISSALGLPTVSPLQAQEGGIPKPAQAAPRYKFDPNWPKLPLPNKWWMMGVTGLFVDNDDHIWVLNRPKDIDNTQNYAQLNPPTAECCVAPPAIIEFDAEGNVINSWDTPQGHGMMVDRQGNVWIGSDTLRKYSHDGKLIAEAARAPEAKPPAGKYGPDSKLIVGELEEVRADEQAREVYIVDNYLNGRVLVYDMDTLALKRGWGAYGKPLSEISTNTKTEYDPKGPLGKDFLGHVTIGLSNDGFVYVADRRGDRIQVLTKEGKFIKEFAFARWTLNRGSAGGVEFSADSQQRYLIVPDISNNTVWFLNREDGKVVGRVGSPGNNGGQFHGLHMLSVDSKGNIYTGEVQAGERVQRFLLVR